MTQEEFDAELASGKSSWHCTHVPGDLDISGKLIPGDLNLQEICVQGDLDLSGTIIHGTLNLFMCQVTGNLDLSGVRAHALKSVGDPGEGALERHGLIFVRGQIFSEDLRIASRLITLPTKTFESGVEET